MSMWADVRQPIMDLQRRDPQPLTGYPSPRGDVEQAPPFSISLASWAVADAAQLHERFGDDVTLTVGAFAYPTLEHESGPTGRRPQVRTPAYEAGLSVSLAGPLVVRSGYALRADVLVSNGSALEVTILTNRQLQSRIVADDGAEVGGYTGAQRMPGVTFDVAPAATVVIPVLIGTDSLDPALGYAIPPGHWSVQVELDLRDGRRLRSAPLPLTVTE